ncbi:type II toxin-antitoxin system PemK/MazF family toxin [Arthrobacter halodurans]|uniref:Type II toxin-antitoxin system PemK/MazF family toxin n=1 Tax=Arthrobacter halodurans TaxID=516699 RepID=A0ABV4UL36_9MICC
MQSNGRHLMKLLESALRLFRPGAPSPTRPGGPVPGAAADRRPKARLAGAPISGAVSGEAAGWRGGGYPGDFTGRLRPTYHPRPDGEPDPGEVVWAWVPYEEDHGRGKDRPVLLVGHDGGYLLGLMLTSKDRNNGSGGDSGYVDIGSGAWDSKGRPSEVRVDRVVRLLPEGIRREGAVLARDRFEQVAARLR